MKFGWYIITSKINDTKNSGTNTNIFMYMILLKLEHANKQAYQYWIPVDDNDFPDALAISDIDTAGDARNHPFFFARVWIEMIVKGIRSHISTASFQELLLEKQNFHWTGTKIDQKWDELVMLWLILKKINPTTQVGISKLKDATEQVTLQKSNCRSDG